MSSKPQTSPDKDLVRAFQAAGVVDYLEYLKSGKRIFWVNFKAGVARGLGMTIGMTVILGIFIWVLTMLVDLPLVGEYFEQAKVFVTEYVDNTNLQDEYLEMNQLLQEIEENTREETAQYEPDIGDEPLDTPEEQADAQGLSLIHI